MPMPSMWGIIKSIVLLIIMVGLVEMKRLLWEGNVNRARIRSSRKI